MHQHLFFELILNRYFIISKFLLLQIMLQYGFIKYILGFNMGTFEFPTIEILVPTCILNYKIYYQFALEIRSIYTSINNIQNYLFIHIVNSVLLTFFDFCKYDRWNIDSSLLFKFVFLSWWVKNFFFYAVYLYFFL